MDNFSYFSYLLLMAGSTYLIRAIPFALMKKKIQNKFIRSFLYYIPYTVLTAMTFPAALYVTDSVISAGCGLIAAVILAVKNKGLTVVAAASCGTVLLVELIMKFLGA